MIRKQKKHVLASVSEIPRNNDELNEALITFFLLHLPSFEITLYAFTMFIPCFYNTL